MISSKTLYLTADRENVVEEGDPKAQFLLVRAGMELPDATAEKYGVTEGKKPATPSPEPSPAAAAQNDGGPQPQNREAAMKPRKTRGKK